MSKEEHLTFTEVGELTAAPPQMVARPYPPVSQGPEAVARPPECRLGD